MNINDIVEFRSSDSTAFETKRGKIMSFTKNGKIRVMANSMTWTVSPDDVVVLEGK